MIPNTTAKEQLVITGGNHLGFFDADIAGLFQIEILLGLDNPSTISVERQHEISRGYYTAWFQYYLKGITEYKTYISGNGAQNDLNTGVLTALEYNIP